MCHRHLRAVPFQRPQTRNQDSNAFPCITDWQKDNPDPSTKARLTKTPLVFLPSDTCLLARGLPKVLRMRKALHSALKSRPQHQPRSRERDVPHFRGTGCCITRRVSGATAGIPDRSPRPYTRAAPGSRLHRGTRCRDSRQHPNSGGRVRGGAARWDNLIPCYSLKSYSNFISLGETATRLPLWSRDKDCPLPNRGRNLSHALPLLPGAASQSRSRSRSLPGILPPPPPFPTENDRSRGSRTYPRPSEPSAAVGGAGPGGAGSR